MNEFKVKRIANELIPILERRTLDPETIFSVIGSLARHYLRGTSPPEACQFVANELKKGIDAAVAEVLARPVAPISEHKQ